MSEIETVPPTERQKKLEAEVTKSFLARLYNNTINNRKVYTGCKSEKKR